MTGLRWRMGSWLVVVVMSLLLCVSGGALADDQPTVDITGHWASPLEASGIDLVQSGNSVQGSSLSGLHLSGTIDGRRVEFTYWDGPSYAEAHREDRGTGVMVVAKNGKRAKVTWQNDRKKAPEVGSFVIVRVGKPDLDGWTNALEDVPAASPGPSPGSGLSLEEEIDALYDEVTTPSSTPAAVPDTDGPTLDEVGQAFEGGGFGPGETPAAVPDTDTSAHPSSESNPAQPLEGWDADETFLDFFDAMLELLGSTSSGE